MATILSRAMSYATGKRTIPDSEGGGSEMDDTELVKRMKLPDMSKKKCSCGDAQCAQIQRDWLSFNNTRVGWVLIPELPTGPPKGARKVARHATHLRRVQLFQDFIVNNGGNVTTERRSERYISYVHFHPSLLEWVEKSMNLSSKKQVRFPSVVPAECGRIAGLLHEMVQNGDWVGQCVTFPTLTCVELRTELMRVKFQRATILSVPPSSDSMQTAPNSAPNHSHNDSGDSSVSLTPRDSLSSGSGESVSSGGVSDYVLSAEEATVLNDVRRLAPEQTASVLCDLEHVEQQLRADALLLRDRLQQAEERVRVLESERKWFTEVFASRVSLTSDVWHRENPKAAKYLFGFRSWDETKGFMEALFGVEAPTQPVNPAAPLSVFEELLATKMRFRKRYGLLLLAILWGKGEKTMGRIVRARAPEWGEAGLDLSILDLPAEYLAADLPQEYLDSPILSRTSGLVDGKCFKTNTFRKNSALSRAQHANKVEWSALLSLNWQTPSGLSIEHTAPFLGRASETALVKLWGSHVANIPTTNVPVAEEEMAPLCNARYCGARKHVVRGAHLGPGVGREHSGQAAGQAQGGQAGGRGGGGRAYRAASAAAAEHDGTAEDAHEVEEGHQQLQQLSHRLAQVGIGLLDEHTDVRLEAEAASEVAAAAGPEQVAASPAAAATAPPATSLGEEVLSFFDERAARANSLQATDVTSSVALNSFNEQLLAEDTPNASVARKLRQLRRLHTLDTLYRTKRLQPSSLSYYLYHTRQQRHRLLDYYTSQNRTEVAPQDLPVRLGKFHANSLILADRGFYYHAILYPHLNGCVTPHFASGRAQFTQKELHADQDTTRLRYTSEVGFDRVTMEEVLQDEIPFAFFNIVHDVHHWAHANCNILNPLREPAGWSTYVRTDFPPS